MVEELLEAMMVGGELSQRIHAGGSSVALWLSMPAPSIGVLKRAHDSTNEPVTTWFLIDRSRNATATRAARFTEYGC